MIEINYAKALELIQAEIAKEGPNYVYSNVSCSNVETKPDGTLGGSCLIGRAIVAAGLDPEVIVLSGCNSSGIWGLASSFRDDFKLTRKALALMEAVQSRQDQRAPWGEALKMSIPISRDHDDLMPFTF